MIFFSAFQNEVKHKISMEIQKCQSGTIEWEELSSCFGQPILGRTEVKYLTSVANEIMENETSDHPKDSKLQHLLLAKSFNGKSIIIIHHQFSINLCLTIFKINAHLSKNLHDDVNPFQNNKNKMTKSTKKYQVKEMYEK